MQRWHLPLLRCEPFSFSLAPLPKLALGAAVALAALSLSAGPAHAASACAFGTAATLCRLTVGVLTYEVTVFTGSYNGDTSKFETEANNGVMPWWTGTGGTSDTATVFATGMGDYFGAAVNPDLFSSFGPIFAYKIAVFDNNFINSATRFDNGFIFSADVVPRGNTVVYARATLYTPQPQPRPLSPHPCRSSAPVPPSASAAS